MGYTTRFSPAQSRTVRTLGVLVIRATMATVLGAISFTALATDDNVQGAVPAGGDQIFERSDVIELCGVDQAHEHVTDVGARKGSIEQGIFSIW